MILLRIAPAPAPLPLNTNQRPQRWPARNICKSSPVKGRRTDGGRGRHAAGQLVLRGSPIHPWSVRQLEAQNTARKPFPLPSWTCRPIETKPDSVQWLPVMCRLDGWRNPLSLPPSATLLCSPQIFWRIAAGGMAITYPRGSMHVASFQRTSAMIQVRSARYAGPPLRPSSRVHSPHPAICLLPAHGVTVSPP
jgi:hypothetical protein